MLIKYTSIISILQLILRLDLNKSTGPIYGEICGFKIPISPQTNRHSTLGRPLFHQSVGNMFVLNIHAHLEAAHKAEDKIIRQVQIDKIYRIRDYNLLGWISITGLIIKAISI